MVEIIESLDAEDSGTDVNSDVSDTDGDAIKESTEYNEYSKSLNSEDGAVSAESPLTDTKEKQNEDKPSGGGEENE